MSASKRTPRPAGSRGKPQKSRSQSQGDDPAVPPLPALSHNSSPAVPRSLWSSEDFMLGAGAIIIQPSTRRVCILEEAGRVFLPRGRKDVGESLEQAALREAYEESSYRVTFLPALHKVLQPRAPGAAPTTTGSLEERLTTEAISVSLTPYTRRPHRSLPANAGGEYLVFWYLCQIAEDAVPDEGTRMPDEQNYVTHLAPYADALAAMNARGDPYETAVLARGIKIWLQTEKLLSEARAA